jgi:hypothetical protein
VTDRSPSIVTAALVGCTKISRVPAADRFRRMDSGPKERRVAWQ